MRKTTLMVLAAAAAMGLACSDSDNNSVTGTDLVAVDGVYTLQTVDGLTVPYLLYQQDTTTITAMDGHLAITTGGSWTETVTRRTISGIDTTTETASASGTLYHSGSSLVFADMNNNLYYTGTASTNRLDLLAGSVTVVYAK